MFLVALAAAAASPHSVTGALGYVLGQAPPAKVATCNRTWLAKSKTTFFGCPGDGFFNNFAITVKHNEVTDILATRHYPAGAMKTCVADVNRLKAQVWRNNPGLMDAQNKSAIFDLTDRLVIGYAMGRSITGSCTVQPRAAQSGGDYMALFLSYTLSPQERVQLRKLDQ